MFSSIFFVQVLLFGICSAGYVLETSFTSANWFSQFSFFTVSCPCLSIRIPTSWTQNLSQSADPTAGYVNYVDQTTATNNGYINTNNGVVYIGVDHTNVVNGTGRNSVRIVSNAAYNYGLFALDVSHMPGGICGTWQVLRSIFDSLDKQNHRLIDGHDRPAFWMVGPNWPNDGEIDIIEGVNDNANNAMTLHTSDGCSITNDGAFAGVLTTSNCYVSAPGQIYNAGCDIQDSTPQSYGADFNSNGGGVIVTEWTDTDINIWFFPRGTTPSDLESGTPDPASWQEPVAQFQGSCDIQNHFADMQIVKDPIYLLLPPIL